MAEHPNSKAGCRTRAEFFTRRTDAFSTRRFSKIQMATGATSSALNPTLMTDEDFDVYQIFLWNFGDAKSLNRGWTKCGPKTGSSFAAAAPTRRPSRNWNGTTASVTSGSAGCRAPAPPGRAADHSRDGTAAKVQRSDNWSNCRAKSKSFFVRPPASCVVSTSVTLFQRISMSG